MPQINELRLDAASGLALGQREAQQDAIASDFPLGTGFGLAVLADGMGGHAAGEIAAQIAITEVFADLKLRGVGLGGDIPGAMRLAALAANRCIAAHCSSHPDTAGMGTTLLVLVFDHLSLHWLSIGDSQLLLWRDGSLRRLNQRHSLADRLDWMVSTGQISEKTGLSHPERHLLTSCLNGDRVDQIDSPEAPLSLLIGDVILMASDGLDSLTTGDLTRILTASAGTGAANIVTALLSAVAEKDVQEQDNLSLTVVCPVPWRIGTAPRQDVNHVPAKDVFGEKQVVT